MFGETTSRFDKAVHIEAVLNANKAQWGLHGKEENALAVLPKSTPSARRSNHSCPTEKPHSPLKIILRDAHEYPFAGRWVCTVSLADAQSESIYRLPIRMIWAYPL